MTFKQSLPRTGHPLSRRSLRQRGGADKALYAFLEMFAINDVVHEIDDFIGDAINLDKYAVANGGGASAASFAINTQQGGVVRATTGTANDATASASLITPAQWSGDKYAGVEFYWTPITAVTEARVEVGFSDVVPGSNASVVATLATPTVNASVVDAAVDTYNHTGSTTTNQITTIGSSIDALKSTFTPVTAVAAATKVRTRIQLVGNHVYLWRDGVLLADHNTPGTDYIEGGSLIAVWAYVRANNATSKSLDLDAIRIWQER